MTKQKLLENISDCIKELDYIKNKSLKEFKSVLNSNYEKRVDFAVDTLKDQIEQYLYNFMYSKGENSRLKTSGSNLYETPSKIIPYAELKNYKNQEEDSNNLSKKDILKYE